MICSYKATRREGHTWIIYCSIIKCHSLVLNKSISAVTRYCKPHSTYLIEQYFFLKPISCLYLCCVKPPRTQCSLPWITMCVRMFFKCAKVSKCAENNFISTASELPKRIQWIRSGDELS